MGVLGVILPGFLIAEVTLPTSYYYCFISLILLQLILFGPSFLILYYGGCETIIYVFFTLYVCCLLNGGRNEFVLLVDISTLLLLCPLYLP
jgi:hypothetical protein|tara:strand:+ start:488 stop:760 length:273 start_codon:yes stop_codon:yes gene_type:complete